MTSTVINEVRDYVYNFKFDILICYFEIELSFKMFFCFGFRFGNKWFGLGTSSQFLGFEFFSNIYDFVVGIDGLLLMSHDSRVVNNSSTLALPILSFVIV